MFSGPVQRILTSNTSVTEKTRHSSPPHTHTLVHLSHVVMRGGRIKNNNVGTAEKKRMVAMLRRLVKQRREDPVTTASVREISHCGVSRGSRDRTMTMPMQLQNSTKPRKNRPVSTPVSSSLEVQPCNFRIASGSTASVT